MINTQDHALLYVPFRRRSQRRRAHDCLVHRTGHPVLNQTGSFMPLQQIGYGTHCSDHLTKGKQQGQCHVSHMNLWNHQIGDAPQKPAFPFSAQIISTPHGPGSSSSYGLT